MGFFLARPGNPTECTTVVLKSANGASDRVPSQWGKASQLNLGTPPGSKYCHTAAMATDFWERSSSSYLNI